MNQYQVKVKKVNGRVEEWSASSASDDFVAIKAFVDFVSHITRDKGDVFYLIRNRTDIVATLNL